MQWRMLQQDIPEDYVIATGRQRVLEIIELSASKLGWTNTEGKSIYWKVRVLMRLATELIMGIL